MQPRPARSVAVIGHGASLDGAGLGPMIDACGLVVRMNDCWWQFGGDKAADFGTRWDFGVLPGPWGADLWARDFRPEVASPVLGWWCYTLRGEQAPGWFARQAVMACDLSATTRLLLRPGMERASPSRGLAGALMALAFYAGLDRVMLFGCDRLRLGTLDDTGYSRQLCAVDARYAEQTAHGLSGPIVGPHHYGAEQELLLERAVVAGGVEVVFTPAREDAIRPAVAEMSGSHA